MIITIDTREGIDDRDRAVLDALLAEVRNTHETPKPQPEEAADPAPPGSIWLADMSDAELRAEAKRRGLSGYSAYKKAELREWLETGIEPTPKETPEAEEPTAKEATQAAPDENVSVDDLKAAIAKKVIDHKAAIREKLEELGYDKLPKLYEAGNSSHIAAMYEHVTALG